MTAAETCLLCGHTKVEAHHISGRDPDRRYLDPELTVPLCGECHQLAGADNRAERVETPDGTQWSLLASVEWWLKRVALFAARACQYYDVAWLVALAASLRRNADTLALQRRILDERYPGWHEATLCLTAAEVL